MQNRLNRISRKVYKIIERLFQESFAILDKKISYIAKKIKTFPIIKSIRSSYIQAYVLLFCPIFWIILLSAGNFLKTISYAIFFLFGAILAQLTYFTLQYIFRKNLIFTKRNRELLELQQNKCNKIPLSYIAISLVLLDTIFIAMLPYKAIIASLITIVMASILYFVAKRMLYFEWILAALTFNMGIWIAWYTISNAFEMTPIIVYAGCCIWTLGYMIVFGQSVDEKNNDEFCARLAFISKSIGQNIEAFAWSAYKLSLILFWLAGFNTHLNVVFTLIYTLAIYMLYSQVHNINIDNKKDCKQRFMSNISFAIIISLAIMSGLL